MVFLLAHLLPQDEDGDEAHEFLMEDEERFMHSVGWFC